MNVPKMIEQNGQRVLTTKTLAEMYGTSTQRISHNFSQNKKRYVEGRHFYYLTGESLKKFAVSNLDTANNGGKLYLWTERGALLHAKSLNTDKAWEVYDFLVEHYFRAKSGYEVLLDFPEETPAEIEKKRSVDAASYYRLSAIANMKKADAELAQSELMVFVAEHPWVAEIANEKLLTGSGKQRHKSK